MSNRARLVVPVYQVEGRMGPGRVSSAARGLRGVDQILVSGLSSQAAPYLQARDAEALADSVLRHAPAATRKKVARLEKTIRTGKL